MLLNRVETAAGKVGMKMNAAKTKYMCFNHKEESVIKTNDNTHLEQVEDFKYLGAWMNTTEKDIKTRKAAAWRACSRLSQLWKSNSLSRKFKERLFIATVESVLLYGCEAWTVTPRISKQLDGCYTRMLRSVFNIHWSQHITNKELYGELPKISSKIRERRLRFAGHCFRRTDEAATKLIHWIPMHGGRRPGRPALTYIDLLKRDTGLQVEELKTAMQDRRIWRAITVRENYPT